MQVDAISVEVAKLSMKPDDMLVVRLPPRITWEGRRHLVDYLRSIPAMMALGDRIAFLPAEVELVVVTKAEVPPCAT